MASIVKDPRRGTYLIQWFDGKRWRRATVHTIPGWKPARSSFPARDPLPVTRSLAEYAEREREARRGRARVDPRLTVADFLDAYEATYRIEQAAGSLVQLRQARRNFLGWCREARVARFDAVTPGVCQRFLDWRAGRTSRKTGRPISPGRLTQERALLSAAWTRALKLGEIAANPWAATHAPGWQKRKKARVRRPSWTPEEFDRLVATCNPWLRDILTFGTQTGIRISALLALEWRDVHWAGDGDRFGEVEVRPEIDKAGKGYRVPISRKCHDLLARRFLDKTSRSDIILTGHGGDRTTLHNTANSIVLACRRAGLPRPISPNHHLRRSFGRWAVIGHLTGRPVPLYVVSRWLGHASVKMSEMYLDIHADDSHDWMAEFEPHREGHRPDADRNASSGQDPVST